MPCATSSPRSTSSKSALASSSDATAWVTRTSAAGLAERAAGNWSGGGGRSQPSSWDSATWTTTPWEAFGCRNASIHSRNSRLTLTGG